MGKYGAKRESMEQSGKMESQAGTGEPIGNRGAKLKNCGLSDESIRKLYVGTLNSYILIWNEELNKLLKFKELLLSLTVDLASFTLL